MSADHHGLLAREKVHLALRRELRLAEEEAPRVRGRLTAMRSGRARPAGAQAPAAGSGGADAA